MYINLIAKKIIISNLSYWNSTILLLFLRATLKTFMAKIVYIQWNLHNFFMSASNKTQILFAIYFQLKWYGSQNLYFTLLHTIKKWMFLWKLFLYKKLYDFLLTKKMLIFIKKCSIFYLKDLKTIEPVDMTLYTLYTCICVSVHTHTQFSNT